MRPRWPSLLGNILRATAERLSGRLSLVRGSPSLLSTVFRPSWDSSGLLLLTGGCATIGAIGSILLTNMHPTVDELSWLSWRVGRWGAWSAVIGTLGILIPLVIATDIFDPAIAGIYRTLQTVQGPLNVLAASAGVTLTSTAWRYPGTGRRAGAMSKRQKGLLLRRWV